MSTRPAARLPSPGDVIERYQVLGSIAKGGMAEVFLARRVGPGGFDKRVAMKVMHAHLGGQESFVSMFLDEARIASSIEHPNVVRVLDVGLYDEELPWIVMELLHGQTLSALMRSADSRLSIGILLGVAQGLHAAHEARGTDGVPLEVVHRDVSPQNIHVGYDGQVKVVDFGIAAAEGRLTHTKTGEVKGKVSYISPEQIKYPGERVDRRSDIWAFGVVAWEVFARRRLFAQGDAASKLYQILNEPIPELRSIANEVPQPVAAIVDACLCRDPDERPQDASEIVSVFREAIADTHAWLRDDLVTHMEHCFGEARRRSEELIESFLTSGLAHSVDHLSARPPALEELPSPGAPTEELPAAESPSRRGLWAAIVALAVVVVGVVAMSQSGASDAIEASGDSPEQRDAPIALHAPPPAEVTSVQGAEPSAARVTVSIGQRVREVRVAGEVRSDRPLVLEVPLGEQVEVELLGHDGASARRRVGAAQDGATLSLPRRRSRGMRSRRTQEAEDLMESPY